MSTLIDIKDKQFGKLTALHNEGYGKWKCICECGKEVIREGFNLRAGTCTSCGCDYWGKGNKGRRWKGYEELGSKFWTAIKRAAKERDIEFNIDIEYGWNLYIEQKRRCALTGRIIGFDNDVARYDNSASLDRIDSSIGYVKGNVQWVHKDINRMKWIFTNEQFLTMCKEVINYDKEKNTSVER